ncbi:hypothetical protein B0H10DRAFT_2229579 [Mycena sp. CBHHK59/15]|nr:hypothetical protein B0H10DRAFT_2229579 [Mycena sp. CBHHK59/15]
MNPPAATQLAIFVLPGLIPAVMRPAGTHFMALLAHRTVGHEETQWAAKSKSTKPKDVEINGRIQNYPCDAKRTIYILKDLSIRKAPAVNHNQIFIKICLSEDDSDDDIATKTLDLEEES